MNTADRAALPPPVPREIRTLAGGRYLLLERIGRGGGGDVYRARELGVATPRDVCIKRLNDHVADHVRALREEARLLAGIRHSNVVSLHAIYEEPNGSPFLVLELIRGWNLRALCRHLAAIMRVPPAGYLPEMVAVHIACAVLRALAAMQRAIVGIVHRDVNPQNILISNEGEVKLTDFGIALAIDRARWTRPSLIKGKFGYMAPEQIRGDRLDVRSDLFAVGVTLFELLVRTRPCGELQGVEELRAIERGDITSLARLRPRLDRGLLAAVDRLLAWNVADRFPTADEALRALAPYSAGDLGSLRLAALTSSMRPYASAPELVRPSLEKKTDPRALRPQPLTPRPLSADGTREIGETRADHDSPHSSRSTPTKPEGGNLR